jgi:anti-sigma factor RsiW
MTCPTLETASAWLLGELSETEAEAFEEHYFACDACAARVQRLERTLAVLSRGLPFALTPARRDALLARGSLPAVDVAPGQRATLRLSRSAPAGLWVMSFTEPSVVRVDLEARSTSGQVLISLPDVAFDAERGRVYMPCQYHYQARFGPQESTLVVQLSSLDESGATRKLGEYFLEHEFESL